MKTAYTQHFATWPNSNERYSFILFLIWPFLAFILAIVNYSRKESRQIVYLFLLYYGVTFVIQNEFVDSSRYAMSLKINAQLPFSEFFRVVGGLYNSETSVDIYEPFVSFLVSRFTNNHGVLFAVYTAVFAFFYLKSINLLHDRYNQNPGWNAITFLAFFVMIIPVTAINGVRMYTAAWIFFYAAYHVVLERNTKYLILALASSLVHFSFLSANIVLLIYYLAGNRNLIYLPITVASFIVPDFIAPFLQSLSYSMGGALQSRVEGYTSENYIYAQQESLAQSSWFLQISNNLIFYYLILSIIFIQIRYGSLMKDKSEKNLFSFMLLFLSFVNFGMPIASFGARFQALFFLFATMYIFLFYLKLPGNRVYLMTLLGLFPMLLYTLINFRLGTESISAWILAPGLGSPLFLPVLSVAELFFY